MDSFSGLGDTSQKQKRESPEVNDGRRRAEVTKITYEMLTSCLGKKQI